MKIAITSVYSLTFTKSVKVLLTAITFVVMVSVVHADVISTTTASCVDETTGLNIGTPFHCGAQASATVSGLGTPNLVVGLIVGAGIVVPGDVEFKTEADATVVAYAAGPRQEGSLLVTYFSDRLIDGSGGAGGSISIDGGHSISAGITYEMPYEVGTPFTLRASAYAEATCLPDFRCGVGAFTSVTEVSARYMTWDGRFQEWIFVPILDYSPTPVPEPPSSALLLLSAVTVLCIQRTRSKARIQP